MWRRSMNLEPGLQKDGPSANPMRKTVSMRSPTPLLTWNSWAMSEMEEEGAEEANMLHGSKARQSNQAGRMRAEG
jgi:hypothetical protein